MSAVLQSIQIVSDLARNNRQQKVPRLEIVAEAELPPELPLSVKNAKSLKAIRSLSQAISEATPVFDYDYKGNASLFAFLLRDCSENFHSDFIASLLDSKRSGVVAQRFFAAMIRYATSEEVKEQRHISAHREVELKKLLGRLEGKPLGNRRIDILAYTDDFMIVIENKVNSAESESQTQDYHDCVREHNSKLYSPKKIIEIFLSPTGVSANCPNYKSMTYYDLFVMLHDIHQTTQVQPFEFSHFFKMYLDSLYEQYYLRQIEYLNFLKDFWRAR